MQKGGTIAIPRKEYKEFMEWRGFIKTFKTFTPSPREARMLRKAREDFKKGNYITLDELGRQLGTKN